MANLLKLKRPNSLGAPPPLNEASQNVKASEIAPGVAASSAAMPSEKPPAAQPIEKNSPMPARIDGRSLRKSGRLIPFATRVSEQWDQRFRSIAQRDDLLFVELLEQSLDAYEAARNRH